jgi:hypothetical protein
MNNALTALDNVQKQLARVATVDEAKGIRDRAEALRVYVKQTQRGLEAQNHCAYVKILAERRAGELLAHLKREPGKRNGEETSFQRALRLAIVAGPTAHRWQIMAQVPERVIQKLRDRADAQGMELTSAAVYRLGNKLCRGRWDIDSDANVRQTGNETYRRLLTRAENVPNVEQVGLGLWLLSRADLEQLLAAYLGLRVRVEASVAALRRQIDIEIEQAPIPVPS